MRLTAPVSWMRPLAAAALAGWLLSVPTTNAQTQSPTPAPSDRTANIPDQKLDAAAAALQQVANVKQDYQQRLATAAEPDKKRIADQAHDELVKAVTDQGLSVEEYTSILIVAQNDASVREKLIERLHSSAKQ
jgi:predicted TIM-barrel fold metal-dependent hydrolase